MAAYFGLITSVCSSGSISLIDISISQKTDKLIFTSEDKISDGSQMALSKNEKRFSTHPQRCIKNI